MATTILIIVDNGSQPSSIRDLAKHHVWCNNFGLTRDDCQMCKNLYEKYPVGEMSNSEMLAKYFPNVEPAEQGKGG